MEQPLHYSYPKRRVETHDMQNNPRPKRVLIIDVLDYWRQLSVKALEKAGFSAHTLSSYDYPPSASQTQEEIPDLVILGCAHISPEEKQLIKRVLKREQRLLVLSTSLSTKVMRTLFLAGVDDVVNKPYDPDRLVSIVEQALQSTSVLNSYQSVCKRGVYE
jgi:DNA-binding response OmpR family regulator